MSLIYSKTEAFKGQRPQVFPSELNGSREVLLSIKSTGHDKFGASLEPVLARVLAQRKAASRTLINRMF
jgi:hypothetical protein